MTDVSGILSTRISPRRRAETRFRWYGAMAIFISLSFLAVMIGSIGMRGLSAFQQSFVQIEIDLPKDKIDTENLRKAPFGKMIKAGLRE